ATPDEWFHFDLVLGMTDRLLPVVSNPCAELSPNSKLSHNFGKSPRPFWEILNGCFAATVAVF
ncbi:hypothetical protein ACSLOE_30345, partial [Escherichia coli]|uniref:hypothetical protein n=1 Tax=Escherichia coli TaxID=562 RepID=UPI003EDED899